MTLTVAVLAMVATANATVVTAHRLFRQLESSDAEFERQMQEVQVLEDVLQECEGICRSSNTVPRSIEHAMDVCTRRLKDLMWHMDRLFRLYRSQGAMAVWRRRLSAIGKEEERRRALIAFRDSVLLLRDLCSEYVIVATGPKWPR